MEEAKKKGGFEREMKEQLASYNPAKPPEIQFPELR